MKDNDVLGGFSAVFDTLSPNEDMKLKGFEVIEDANDPTTDTKALDINTPNPFTIDDEPDEIVETSTPEESKKDVKTETEEEKPKEVTEDSKEDEKPTETVDDSETEQVTAFFDAIAEQVGWNDITEEEKPKSVDDFVSYMKSAVEESSKPQYANDDIAALDEYVKAGGSLNDYFTNASLDVDYESLDVSDLDTQKALVKEFLTEKGFSDTQIKRKLEKYEDADLLEDEATDAVEFLKESKEQKKKALLEDQRTAYESNIKEQQTFYNNVTTQIEALADVRGIKIPKEDKKLLAEYIFRVEPDGRTKYQKDYSNPEKMAKNLIESAYFTWKGDKLIENAKRSGETSATERLKNTLKTNKVSGSKQSINNGSPTPLWSIASQQLLRRPQ